MKLILLGAPGSGKGTLARYLIEKHNYVQLSTGDLFRKEIRENGPMAEKLKNIMISGSLVEDEITNNIIKNEILKLVKEQKSFVLDGYPRTIEQAKFLEKITNVDHAILLTIEKELAIKRMIGRRQCPTCGAIYNIFFSTPIREGMCDLDQTPLIQRKDDQEEVCRNRFAVYHEQTEPLIVFYQNKKILKEINGDQETGKIIESIEKIIGSKND